MTAAVRCKTCDTLFLPPELSWSEYDFTFGPRETDVECPNCIAERKPTGKCYMCNESIFRKDQNCANCAYPVIWTTYHRRDDALKERDKAEAKIRSERDKMYDIHKNKAVECHAPQWFAVLVGCLIGITLVICLWVIATHHV